MKRIRVKSGGSGFIIVRMNQRIEFFVSLNDDALADVGVGVEFVFDFLGIDVLTGSAEEHVLAASADEEIAFGIHETEVARVIPSLAVKRSGGGFGIFEIAEHGVHASREDFAGNVLRVCAVHLHLHARRGFSARALTEMMPVFVGDDGSTLGGTVADRIVESDFLQQTLDLAVEGGTADDDFVEIASEGFFEAVAHLVKNLTTDDGHFEQDLHAVGLKFREHVLLDDFLDDERNGDDDDRLDVAESLQHNLRGRNASEIIDMAAVEEFKNEFKCHAIHVSQRKHGNHLVSGFHMVAQHFFGKHIVGPQSAEGNHHAFGVGGCSAGVVDERESVGVCLMGIVDVFRSEIFRIFLSEVFVQSLSGIGEERGAREHDRIVRNVDNAFKVRHGFTVKFGPNHVSDKKNFGFRVIHDVMDLLRLELVEHGHRDSTITQNGEESGSPVCAVSSAESDAIAFLDTGIFKQNVKFLNLSGYVLVLKCDTLIVCQCICIPVVANALGNQTHKVGVV